MDKRLHREGDERRWHPKDIANLFKEIPGTNSFVKSLEDKWDEVGPNQPIIAIIYNE